MPEETTKTTVTPMLTVSDGVSAVEFYKKAFGADEVGRMEHEGKLVIAELSIEGARFFLSEESPDLGNVGPTSLDGKTTMRIELTTSDPDALAERAIKAGAKEMFPVEDRDYGYRQGRIVDPFGHHWVIGRPIK